MTNNIPTLFVSHGSPKLVMEEGAAHQFLKHLATQLPRPSQILVISAHWQTRNPTVSMATDPETIYDFGGFAPELYQCQYPAPGAAELGERTAGLLSDAGFTPSKQADRGLDHGAWVPLSLIYPDADIPVTQLSIQPLLGPDHHFQIGRALRPLRDEGVLLMASGAITHNLDAFFGNGFDHDAKAPDWVAAFASWMAEAMEQGRIDDLINYRARAPHSVQNHPTEDHLLPMFVALGAASDEINGKRLHASTTYGVLAMDAYTMN